MVIGDNIMLWGCVGLASGSILGLSGSGGAVVAIPILMTFGGYDVKEATGYGLLALSLAAAISWFFQRQSTHYPVTGMLIFFAAVIAFLSAPLKEMSPHWLITALLNLACSFGLYSLWVLRKPDDPGEKKSLSFQLKTATVGGMMTGLLNTMTGLGGGVFIIPWLTGVTRLRFEQAMACSLLTVAITAPVSAWRQGIANLGWGEWLALFVMVILASLSVKKILTFVPHHQAAIIRKLVFTGVIMVTMLRTLTEFL